jgi:hypothetical protein
MNTPRLYGIPRCSLLTGSDSSRDLMIHHEVHPGTGTAGPPRRKAMHLKTV